MEADRLNIIIAGVGGQGNVVASEVLATALSRAGYRVSVGETFGASQRGGSVMSHVRAARDATPGPLIPKGLADVILGFEPLETLRLLADYGRETTRVLVNPRPVYPLAVQQGQARYPEAAALMAKLTGLAAEVLSVDATGLARQAGDIRAQNLAMVGALVGSGWLPVGAAVVERVLGERFAEDVLRLNLEAFRLGREQVRQPA
ncbi:MAG: indolepyruvate oxidoreductase subunit beta [Candidatus Rokubacteria bacterium]|nr:indolepyruvate oxidoreductase subunit beta [Candidatus Rokubacteria bacterium]